MPLTRTQWFSDLEYLSKRVLWKIGCGTAMRRWSRTWAYNFTICGFTDSSEVLPARMRMHSFAHGASKSISRPFTNCRQIISVNVLVFWPVIHSPPLCSDGRSACLRQHNRRLYPTNNQRPIDNRKFQQILVDIFQISHRAGWQRQAEIPGSFWMSVLVENRKYANTIDVCLQSKCFRLERCRRQWARPDVQRFHSFATITILQNTCECYNDNVAINFEGLACDYVDNLKKRPKSVHMFGKLTWSWTMAAARETET